VSCSYMNEATNPDTKHCNGTPWQRRVGLDTMLQLVDSLVTNAARISVTENENQQMRHRVSVPALTPCWSAIWRRHWCPHVVHVTAVDRQRASTVTL